jgi:hypothetical protein
MVRNCLDDAKQEKAFAGERNDAETPLKQASA